MKTIYKIKNVVVISYSRNSDNNSTNDYFATIAHYSQKIFTPFAFVLRQLVFRINHAQFDFILNLTRNNLISAVPRKIFPGANNFYYHLLFLE